MKKLSTLLLTVALVLTSVISLAACTSLPEELKGEKMSKPDTFLTQSADDPAVSSIIKEVKALALTAFGNTSDFYVGYSEDDETVYLVYLSSFGKSTVPGVNYSEVKESIVGIASEISKSVDFGDYSFGMVTTGGSKYASSLTILMIIKDGEIIEDYTSW